MLKRVWILVEYLDKLHKVHLFLFNGSFIQIHCFLDVLHHLGLFPYSKPSSSSDSDANPPERILHNIEELRIDYIPSTEETAKIINSLTFKPASSTTRSHIGSDSKVSSNPPPHLSPPTLLLVCSSDRGLCGAIHSSVSKLSRRLASVNRENTSIVVLGDKAKPQISRDSRQNIIMHFNQVGKNIPTFLDALAIWQTMRTMLPLTLKSSDQKVENTTNNSTTIESTLSTSLSIGIIYNRFISVIAFDTVIARFPSLPILLSAPRLSWYEIEDEKETLANLSEYLLVCRLYWSLVEGHAAEMSAKRTAMENASKNADTMVGALTMQYNRTRQAVITNELVDIIVGASAQA